MDKLKTLYETALKYIPGGVNSPVRSFKQVGRIPLFVKKGNGSKIYDIHAKEYIDYCLSWGALILGHAHNDVVDSIIKSVYNGTSFGIATELEVEFANIIVDAIPSVDKLRLTNSGTESVMTAVRLARAYTGKNKVIKFDGAYHGHADYMLVKAGSGAGGLGMPDSLGVPSDFARHTLISQFNDIDKVYDTVKQNKSDLAAIIVEPVMANCGVILPKDNFLSGLRSIADEFNAVLIFDEVITGFRLLFGSIQQLFGVYADLTCLGKIIGGGMPLAAVGGKREIMDLLAPVGGVYQAGTLSGNPVSVTAGMVTLKSLRIMDPYSGLNEKTAMLRDCILDKSELLGIDLKINCIGSMFSLFFSKSDVDSYEKSKCQNTGLFNKFYHGVLDEGIYFSPSGFEANFLSASHSLSDIERTVSAVNKSLCSVVNK